MIESRHPIERLYHPTGKLITITTLSHPTTFQLFQPLKKQIQVEEGFLCWKKRCFAMNRNGDTSQEGLNCFANHWGGLILLIHSPIDRQLKKILSADNPPLAPLSWRGKVAFVDKVSWVPRTTCTSILDMICTHRIDVLYIYPHLLDVYVFFHIGEYTTHWSYGIHEYTTGTQLTCMFSLGNYVLFCRVNSNHKLCIFQV